MSGRASGNREKCTIEVVVDGAAEVAVRGDNATLTNISGQTPQWRRFECSAPLPANAANFRFSGVDGRGRQQLVREPGNGGAAVVRIEDPDGGSEAYTFDLTWGGSFVNPPVYTQDRNQRVPPVYAPVNPPVNRGVSPGIQACQSAVVSRLRSDGFERTEIRTINAEDRPGGADRVIGFAEAERRNGQRQAFDFSCTVNLDRGTVRYVEVTPRVVEGRGGPARTTSVTPGIAACQQAVEARLGNDGYDQVSVRSINAVDRPGGGDQVSGYADAERYRRVESFNFSCVVNLERGEVRSLDLNRR
jgi:hypothetical protein